MVPFQKVKFESSLKDKTVNMPKAQIPRPITIADIFLETFFFSTIHATDGSSKLMAEVNAAKPNKIKNRDPNNLPPDICPNASGRVCNIKPGPPAASKSYENTIGNITIPANNAIEVSHKMIAMLDLKIDSSFGR